MIGKTSSMCWQTLCAFPVGHAYYNIFKINSSALCYSLSNTDVKISYANSCTNDGGKFIFNYIGSD